MGKPDVGIDPEASGGEKKEADPDRPGIEDPEPENIPQIPRDTRQALIDRGLNVGAFLAGISSLVAQVSNMSAGEPREGFQRLLEQILADPSNFSSDRMMTAAQNRLLNYINGLNLPAAVGDQLSQTVEGLFMKIRGGARASDRVGSTVDEILRKRPIDLTDEERLEIERQIEGRGDLKQIQDVDNEAAENDLRPTFTQTGLNEDRETPEQALAERLQFSSFGHVKPGFGGGSNNPLYLKNLKWDRDVRGIAPGSDPRLTTAPSQRIDYEPYFRYGTTTTMMRGNTTATTLRGAGGRRMDDSQLQNFYGYPIKGTGSLPYQFRKTQLYRMSGDVSASKPWNVVHDMNTGRDLTGKFGGAPFNVINSMPSAIVDRVRAEGTGQNNYDNRGRIEPVCLQIPYDDRQNTFYYQNSTYNPMEATAFENRYEKGARPNRGIPTLWFQGSGTVRRSGSLLPY
jgi:hypothetical protein